MRNFSNVLEYFGEKGRIKTTSSQTFSVGNIRFNLAYSPVNNNRIVVKTGTRDVISFDSSEEEKFWKFLEGVSPKPELSK